MTLGGVHVFSGSGKDDTDYRLELYADGSPAPGLFLVSDGGKITVTPADQSFFTGDSYARSTDAVPAVFSGTRVAFQVRRIGSPTNVADETTYSDLVVLSVIGQRMDRHGDLLTGAAGLVTAQSVYAHEVVEDLLGRVLTFCDPATAVVDETTFAIDQLAYPDGAKAADVLSGLAHCWSPTLVGHPRVRLPNGLHRFTYRAWATEPRYVVSVKDGYGRPARTWTCATGSWSPGPTPTGKQAVVT